MIATGSTTQRRPKRDVDGILLLDKPTGITSNRALQIAKRIFQARKAGHTGSLDPLATGMLPLCFGQATKVSGWLLDADKEYQVTLNIGTRTDTADADGEVIEASAKSAITETELENALAAHRGEIDQVPPMYSALKKDGKRLYELARQGEEVERAARRVCIHELEIESFDPINPSLRVRCSKGTYVRSLVETVCEAMGTLGHVAALRRTHVASFDPARMVSLEELEASEADPDKLDGLLLPADTALEGFPAVNLSADESYYLGNGHAVGHAEPGVEGTVRIYDHNHCFLGLGVVEADGRIQPKRLFVRPKKRA
ncbi:MAG: tRNA pseudouridine(55) synthase TruB [Gammaproteobacteria bacterium]